MDKIKYIAVSSALFVGIWLFWWLGYPEMLSYQEQYQLFLFTGDYFAERMSAVGGLADYVSEFLVQFYYVPAIGAAMIALVLTGIQALLAAYCAQLPVKTRHTLPLYMLSALPSLMLLHYMGDENILLSYPVAITIALLMTVATPQSSNKLWVSVVELVLGSLVLYLLCGPVAVLYPILVTMKTDGTKHKWILAIVSVVAACGIVIFFAETICRQYPYSQLLLGINYYRISNLHPTGLFVVVLIIIFLPILRFIPIAKVSSSVLTIISAAVILIAVIYVPYGFDQSKLEIFRYDSLVRQGKWHDIIEIAKKDAPTGDFCLQGLNLALAKTGQLTDRMFEFPQNGINSLIGKRQLDNTTCLITAETMYHLGMVNTAFRYNFDTQEAIMNDRKSGRFMKRMAECMIINGKYDVASKYIDMLKNSLYYSKWAYEAEKYLHNDEAINSHPEWGEKRRIRFRQEVFYDYSEIEKMLGLLAIESAGQNLLAWDYFNAALMLKGDLPTLCGMYHYADETFHLTEIPKHIQEAIAMYWTMGHPTFEGIPYAVSEDVKTRIAALARTYSQNPNNPSAWADAYGDTFWVYFIKSQVQGSPQSTSEPKGTAREG